jgi:DNA-binding beta-propeller fold protein YncE
VDRSSNRVREVSGGIIKTVAGNGTAGYAGDGGPATSAAIGQPQGICLDQSGNIYMVDNDNNLVRKIAASNGTITTIAGGGSDQTAGSPAPGDGGPATSAYLDNPTGVAVDGGGNIYVADWCNHRIQKFTGDGTYLTQWGSYGSGNGQLNYPYDVAVDASGNVYVADTNNQRIQKFGSGLVAAQSTTWGRIKSLYR